MTRHRVAVTGLGAVSPLGRDVTALVDGLIAGRSGIARIASFDVASLPTQIAGEAPLPDVVPFGDRKIGFALAAAAQAIGEATKASPLEGGRDAGVSMGVGLELFSMGDLARSKQPGFEPPCGHRERLSFMQTPSDLCVHLIGRAHGLSAPPLVHVSACAAGTDAIGAAYRLVARGERRWMLAGGTDSMINPMGVAGFCALSATSTRNDPPEAASRPFDRTRDGFVMGEGAGALVLERLDHARARGATVLAEIAGYGSSLDAFKISDPHPEGRGASQAMERAIADAGLDAAAIEAVNAHGTGTPKNDPVEVEALKRVLGGRAREVPVSATKSMIGHLISAAGAVEAVATIGCMVRGVVHPTINLNDPDPRCDLDFVVDGPRAWGGGYALSCSYGFGGHNAAIVIGGEP